MDRFIAWLMIMLLPLHAQTALAISHCALHARAGIGAASLQHAGHSEPTWPGRVVHHAAAVHDAGHRDAATPRGGLRDGRVLDVGIREDESRTAAVEAADPAAALIAADPGDGRGSVSAEEHPHAGAACTVCTVCGLATALLPAAPAVPADPGRDRVRADPFADASSVDAAPPRPPPRATRG